MKQQQVIVKQRGDQGKPVSAVLEKEKLMCVQSEYNY